MNENRITHTHKTKKVYSKTKNPEISYLKKIFHSQRCDANPAHRNIPWTLTFEEWKDLVTQNCYICGSEPTLREGKIHMFAGTRVPINGLDRIDTEKGYVYGNVSACCSTCNYMKHKMTLNEMLSHIEKIKKFNA